MVFDSRHSSNICFYSFIIRQRKEQLGANGNLINIDQTCAILNGYEQLTRALHFAQSGLNRSSKEIDSFFFETEVIERFMEI
jgi:hypothetical protein